MSANFSQGSNAKGLSCQQVEKALKQQTSVPIPYKDADHAFVQYDDVGFDSARNKARKKIVILEPAFNFKPARAWDFGIKTINGEEVNPLSPLSSKLKLDVGDCDSNPFTLTRAPHGWAVFQTIVIGLNQSASLQPFSGSEVPQIIPVKMANFLELSGVQTPTSLDVLASALAEIDPSVVNWSGAIEGAAGTQGIKPLQEYILTHPRVLFVNALANIGTSFDDDSYRDFPQKLLDDQSKRPTNVINVTGAGYEKDKVFQSGEGNKFVDVAVISQDGEENSFLAPLVSSFLYFISSRFPKCFDQQTPREFFGKVTQLMTQDQVPALDLPKVTLLQIQSACRY